MAEKKIKLLIVKNIPSPYRNNLFNTMQEIFPEYNIEFEVWYMARNEPNRHWQLTASDFKYPHRYIKGFHPQIGKMYGHINFPLIPALLFNSYDILLVGGYGAPSLAIAPFFSKTRNKIMWSETNLLTTTVLSGYHKVLKKIIFSRYNAFCVPGERAMNYVQKVISADKPFIRLPNTIDDKVYVSLVEKYKEQRHVLRHQYNVDKDSRVFICPARLEPQKGLLEFIRHTESVKGIEILIAGTGSLEQALQEEIKNKNLPVQLLGHKSQEELVGLYAMADIFLLPSISDPSPLTAVEAIASGLPLLISNRIGNQPEVLNGNGWAFDPFDPDSVKAALLNARSESVASLKEMSKKSRLLYFANFDTRTCVHSFAKNLIKLYRSGK